jgi:hypothetical protein
VDGLRTRVPLVLTEGVSQGALTAHPDFCDWRNPPQYLFSPAESGLSNNVEVSAPRAPITMVANHDQLRAWVSESVTLLPVLALLYYCNFVNNIIIT